MIKVFVKLKRYISISAIAFLVSMVCLLTLYPHISNSNWNLRDDRDQLLLTDAHHISISQKFNANTESEVQSHPKSNPASVKDGSSSLAKGVHKGIYLSKPKPTTKTLKNELNYPQRGSEANGLTQSTKPRITPRGWVYKGTEYMRCKVFTIGCFGTQQRGIYTKDLSWRVEDSEMTDSYCIKLCAERKNNFLATFAGIRNGNLCECSPRIKELTNFVESSDCNVPCAGDRDLTCGGNKNITMLFRISGKCSSGDTPSEQEIERSSLGCYEKPAKLDDQMEKYDVERKNSVGNCILKCEREGLTLAIPTDKLCLCGHSTFSFDLTNRVNESLCHSHPSMHTFVYRTLVEDRRCGKRRFLKDGERHASFLFTSFPGSGNTWTRYLIESLTGIYTGSRYDDDSLSRGGQIGEHLPNNDKRILVFKSHRTDDIRSVSPFDAFIHVYRNPYNAILSEFNRRHAGGHTKVIDPVNFPTEEFHDFVKAGFGNKWRKMSELVLRSNRPTFVLSYEDLVKNPIKNAIKLARFILGNKTDEEDLKRRTLCLKLSVAGEFKRRKKRLNFDPYSREDKMHINSEVDMLDKLFKKHGFCGLSDSYRRKL